MATPHYYIERLIYNLSEKGWRLKAAAMVTECHSIDPDFKKRIIRRSESIVYDPEDPLKRVEIDDEIRFYREHGINKIGPFFIKNSIIQID